jgi:hypothetical protein
MNPATELGFVYIVSAAQLTKIGFSMNPAERIYSLRRTNPILEPILVMPGSRELEKALHKFCRSSRVAGQQEWFRFNRKQIAEFSMHLVIIAWMAALASDEKVYVTSKDRCLDAFKMRFEEFNTRHFQDFSIWPEPVDMKALPDA